MTNPMLAGRTALVTGATRGIGRAIATELARAGVRLTLVARDQRQLEPFADELHAVAIACDVGSSIDCERTLLAMGTAPDILVNNAGLFVPASIEETPASDFEAALAVNLAGPFRIVSAFLPTMRARGRGDIVTIGSIADHTTLPGNAAYGASKHGLRALHEVLRAELRGTGVRATLISPGPVDTSLWDDIDPDSREGFTPRSRMLSPHAVAAAVLFALSQPPDVDIELVRLSRS
jgi:NADP-dependent 3-hydroxy acid dehydrogenase YdfG